MMGNYLDNMDSLIEILGEESGNNVWRLLTDGQKIKLEHLLSSPTGEGGA